MNNLKAYINKASDYLGTKPKDDEFQEARLQYLDGFKDAIKEVDKLAKENKRTYREGLDEALATIDKTYSHECDKDYTPIKVDL